MDARDDGDPPAAGDGRLGCHERQRHLNRRLSGSSDEQRVLIVPTAHRSRSIGSAIAGDRTPSVTLNQVSTATHILKRKRGKHGPESRISPLEESPLTKAMRNSINRPGEPVFLPMVGMEFNSAKEAKDFYNLYSWEIGFGIRKGRNRINDNNYTTRQDLVCSCEGISPNITAATCRTGCKAMVRLHCTGDHGWVISRVVTEHNHPCSATYGQNKQWPSHSEIDPMTKDLVLKLRENNIPIGRVCSILDVHGPQSAQPIRKEAVRSLCAKIAQESIKDDVGKTIRLLEEMKSNDVGMEIRFSVDDEGKIKSMLWCTGKNRADYAKFGDVVTFDITYRTNLYSLPFGLFVGVNNHFQSIIFGGVLLTTEKTEDFEWAFSKFSEIMGGKEPETILTDQCQAMAAAIKSIFPRSNHRWCRWHVLRKTKQKVGPAYSKKSKFKKEFNKLVTEERNAAKFERKWKQLMRKYNLDKNQFLQRLYKYRAKWAKPYFMDVFCAVMTSTQRSESANHMLKQFIQRSAPMHMFVRKFNEFQMDRNDQEEEVHFTKQMRRKRRVGVPIERHAESLYTRRMYEKFYNELYCSGSYMIKSRDADGVFEVAHSLSDGNPDQLRYKVMYDYRDKITCQCGLYEHMGLLCRHSLKMLVHLDVKEIPKRNIMARWLKNQFEPDDNRDGKRISVLSVVSADLLKKRAIINCALEVANGTEAISEDAFIEAMEALDSVRRQAYTAEPELERKATHDLHTSATEPVIPTCVSTSMPTSNISCPDRPTKKGRPSSSSLRSWKEEQKRNQSQSTDEENPRNGKTQSIADVLAF